MTTTPSRALVLGGGGVAGIAWESGLLAGLLQAGIDLDAADLVVGTSAGSSVAVSLRDGRLTPERLAERFAATSPAAAARPAHLAEGGAATADGAPGRATPAQEVLEFDGIAFFEAMREAARGGGSEQEVRARIGEWARRTPVSTPLEAWLTRIGARLPKEWPQGRLAVTAVDAEDGALRTFGAEDGVDLVHAVAASCTVPVCSRSSPSRAASTWTAACARRRTPTSPRDMIACSSSPVPPRGLRRRTGPCSTWLRRIFATGAHRSSSSRPTRRACVRSAPTCSTRPPPSRRSAPGSPRRRRWASASGVSGQAEGGRPLTTRAARGGSAPLPSPVEGTAPGV